MYIETKLGNEMILTASTVRKNIYRLLDKVLETGIPLEIERKGRRLKIISDGNVLKLDNLKKRDILNTDPEEIVHIDWSDQWKI